jgi:hypothetical protein
MTDKITELTKEQEEYLPVFRQEWLDKALRTDPIDRKKAEAAVKNLYRINGLAEPEVIFADSPYQCLVYKTLYNKCISEGVPFEVPAKEDIDPDMEVSYSSLWFVGGWDNYWLAFYKFAEYIGVKLENKDKLDAYIEYADNCGCMYAFEGVAFVSDRPEKISFDEEKRLHGEGEVALKFRDGYSIASWHGTQIPEEWITNPETLTTTVALTWENVEQRRCACEILGWDKVLQDPSLNPKIIDEDSPDIGTLIAVDLPDAPDQWFLKYQCGTGRWFAESVNDKSFDTALKANAGGNGWRGEGDPMSFIPFMRT